MAEGLAVLFKAEVMALGENTRFIVPSLRGLDAGTLYEDIYCARGQAENYIKHLKDDLAADRTSCTSFLANCLRLLLYAAGLCLAPATAHPGTAAYCAVAGAAINGDHEAVQDRRAGQAVQEQNRPPSAKRVRSQTLLQTLTERLYLPTPAKTLNSS